MGRGRTDRERLSKHKEVSVKFGFEGRAGGEERKTSPGVDSNTKRAVKMCFKVHLFWGYLSEPEFFPSFLFSFGDFCWCHQVK